MQENEIWVFGGSGDGGGGGGGFSVREIMR